MKARGAWILVGSVVFAVAALAPPLAAAPPAARTFVVSRLSGADEVPARETSGHGTVVFNLNPDGNELRISVTAHLVNVTGGAGLDGATPALGPGAHCRYAKPANASTTAPSRYFHARLCGPLDPARPLKA